MRMIRLGDILNFPKGGKDAGRTSERVSGRDGYERRVVYPVDAIIKRAVFDIRGIRMLAKACADERGGDFGEVPPDPVCETSRRLIAAAKTQGRLIATDDVPGTRYTIRSGESEVRLVQKDRVYYKIKNSFAKSHLKKHSPKYALFEHIVHNILFPECVLDFVGIAEEMHEARLIYRQTAVKSWERPADAEIAARLAALGLSPAERYCFGNDLVFITDVGQDSDNVLKGVDGDLYFIDPIIGFRPRLCEMIDGVLAIWLVGKSETTDTADGITKEERAFIESMIKPMV